MYFKNFTLILHFFFFGARKYLQLSWATSQIWTKTLALDSEKPGP